MSLGGIKKNSSSFGSSSRKLVAKNLCTTCQRCFHCCCTYVVCFYCSHSYEISPTFLFVAPRFIAFRCCWCSPYLRAPYRYKTKIVRIDCIKKKKIAHQTVSSASCSPVLTDWNLARGYILRGLNYPLFFFFVILGKKRLVSPPSRLTGPCIRSQLGSMSSPGKERRRTFLRQHNFCFSALKSKGNSRAWNLKKKK